MIILKCRRCRGSGVLPNHRARIKKVLQSHATKWYFGFPTDNDIEEVDDLPDAQYNEPDSLSCPVCSGRGTFALSPDDWELSVSGDSDDIEGEEEEEEEDIPAEAS